VAPTQPVRIDVWHHEHQESHAMNPFSMREYVRATSIATSLPRLATIATLLLLAACDKTPGTTATATVSNEPQTQQQLSELPLERGFYVDSDTPCEQASHASLLLLQRDGLGGASDFCAFTTIEAAGDNVYRVTQTCADSRAGQAAETSSVSFSIDSRSSFTSVSEHGWERSARRCEQSSLPEPWRDNDISDLM